VDVAVSERECARARRALSLVLDREEGHGTLAALAVHLGLCGDCRQYAAEVSAFTRAVRRASRHMRTVKGERS
jgi:predicted anti-sigma-YlaC factor YlaD